MAKGNEQKGEMNKEQEQRQENGDEVHGDVTRLR